MGAIAEGFVAYAQPLIDQSDGSLEGINKAIALAQICFNLSQLPTESQGEMLSDLKRNLEMNDEEFESFRQALIEPMIRRHEDMFPRMHHRLGGDPFGAFAAWEESDEREEDDQVGYPTKRLSTADRYAPCPCNSGKKYKFCCGRKAR